MICVNCVKYYGDCGYHYKDKDGHLNYKIPDVAHTDKCGYCTHYLSKPEEYARKAADVWNMTYKEFVEHRKEIKKLVKVAQIDAVDENTKNHIAQLLEQAGAMIVHDADYPTICYIIE